MKKHPLVTIFVTCMTFAMANVAQAQQEKEPPLPSLEEPVTAPAKEEEKIEEPAKPEKPAVASPATKVAPDAQGSLATQISKAAKDREARMLAMNEAMLQLQQAGADIEAAKLQRRLTAMIETRDPREDDAVLANKVELEELKKTVADLTTEISKLREVLSQNCRIIDEILGKAVPDISPAVIEEMKNSKKAEVRKAP